MRRISSFILVVSLFLSNVACNNVKFDNPEITQEELKEHIIFLASDSLKGRKPGTAEGLVSAEYIAAKFKQYGYKAVKGESMLQFFDVIVDVYAGDSCKLHIANFESALDSDFVPMHFSINGDLDASVVFVGYGFDIQEDSLVWNDYADVDVTGKWVMILRADPELDNADSKFIPYSSDRSKMLTAKDHGALGVIFVSGEEYKAQDALAKMKIDQTQANLGILGVHVKRKVANLILAKSEKTIANLEEKLNKTHDSQSFVCDTKVNASVEIVYKKVSTQNVVAMLEGTDPELKSEVIVIGGHYDHLGFGGFSSSSRTPDLNAVHYGADDNASGIASVIEIGEKLAANRSQLKRTVVLIAFGAEEIGLIGSKFFMENTEIELANIKSMVNIDMVGRLRNNNLMVGGVGTSKESEKLLNTLNDSILNLSFAYEGFGPSDHSAFYMKDIPVFFFSTGAHADYHTPRDVVDSINFVGLELVNSYVFDVSLDLIGRDSSLTFQESGPKGKAKSSGRSFKVKLGIMPDFVGKSNDGLGIDAVTPGGAAYNGGLQKGDKIVAIEGKEIHNIYEYMARMGTLKPGQTITIDIIRDGQRIVKLIQLQDKE